MANLFGLDIAGIVNDALSGAGGLRPGTLATTSPGTRTGGSLTGGTNPTTTSHSFQGFVETKEVRRKGQVGADLMAVVTIIGASVTPSVVPEVNDVATIDGTSYTLVELLKRDPAEAVYEFAAEA
jgi:hypothetical protein